MTEPGPVLAVVGARPNYMKVAPVLRALAARGVPARLVHTGQHYDPEMSDAFFQDLGMPAPDERLGVGSGTHAEQTAEVMRRFDPLVVKHRPRAVLVPGDVNSTLACALVAAKRGVPVFHIEAGLRSNDFSMPEEINRVVTDRVSDLLFTTEESANQNLAREGVPPDRVRFVGHVMIDSLLAARSRAPAPEAVARALGLPAGFAAGGYGVITLHRPSNVDAEESLAPLWGAFAAIAQRLPLVFPVHPRTRGNLERFGFLKRIPANLWPVPPQGYLTMVGLLASARLVLTDSGGIQEETTALDVPCLTLRENTERPVTIEQGTNTLVGRDPEKIKQAAFAVLAGGGKKGRRPALWDGHAAERIADHILAWMKNDGGRRPPPAA